MDEIAGDAVALMDEVGVERAHVCGVSMGGMVAMWLGINVPHRVDKLVMSNTSSDVSPPDPWQARIEAIQAGGMEAIVEAGSSLAARVETLAQLRTEEGYMAEVIAEDRAAVERLVLDPTMKWMRDASSSLVRLLRGYRPGMKEKEGVQRVTALSLSLFHP